MSPPRSPDAAAVAVLVVAVVLSGCPLLPTDGPTPTATPLRTERSTVTPKSTATRTPATTPAATPSATPTSSETPAGEVLGYRVESAPEGATVVPVSDDRIDVGGPVWRAVEAAAENGTATVPIEGDDFRDARATLRSLPYSDSDDNLGGVYVRTDGTVVRLLLSVDV